MNDEKRKKLAEILEGSSQIVPEIEMKRAATMANTQLFVGSLMRGSSDSIILAINESQSIEFRMQDIVDFEELPEIKDSQAGEKIARIKLKVRIGSPVLIYGRGIVTGEALNLSGVTITDDMDKYKNRGLLGIQVESPEKEDVKARGTVWGRWSKSF